MPEIIETTVHRLNELSDPAKDKARAWYREGGFDHDWYAFVYENFERADEILAFASRPVPSASMAAALGRKPCVYFRGFWSQGDGACFETFYSYQKDAPRNTRRRMPSFTASRTPYRRSSRAISTSSAPKPDTVGTTATNIACRSRSNAAVQPLKA